MDIIPWIFGTNYHQYSVENHQFPPKTMLLKQSNRPTASRVHENNYASLLDECNCSTRRHQKWPALLIVVTVFNRTGNFYSRPSSCRYKIDFRRCSCSFLCNPPSPLRRSSLIWCCIVGKRVSVSNWLLPLYLFKVSTLCDCRVILWMKIMFQ